MKSMEHVRSVRRPSMKKRKRSATRKAVAKEPEAKKSSWLFKVCSSQNQSKVNICSNKVRQEEISNSLSKRPRSTFHHTCIDLGTCVWRTLRVGMERTTMGDNLHPRLGIPSWLTRRPWWWCFWASLTWPRVSWWKPFCRPATFAWLIAACGPGIVGRSCRDGKPSWICPSQQRGSSLSQTLQHSVLSRQLK